MASLSSHERIKQMRRNPYIMNMALGLKIERVAYAMFSLVFFTIWMAA